MRLLLLNPCLQSGSFRDIQTHKQKNKLVSMRKRSENEELYLGVGPSFATWYCCQLVACILREIVRLELLTLLVS